VVEVLFHDDNLEPFLTAVGWVVGYRFDADDWQAVSQGIRDTDAEGGQWYEYEFHGQRPTAFAVAYDEPGCGVARFRAELPPEQAAQVRLLADLCFQFHWHLPGC
jgi:hypothetical protein